MSVDITKVRLGQCTLTYNGQDLGYTKGGCEVSIQNDVTEATIDEFGDAPVKAFHLGTRIEVKATFAEYNYDILTKVINGAVLIEGGDPGGDDPIVDALMIGQKGGVALAGALLKLHPVSAGGSAASDVEIYKAVVMGETKIPFKVDDQTVYEVTWVAIIDEGKADGSMLARLGVAA